MVELSLAHRVTMDRQASVLDEGATTHRARALLAVTSSIALFNLFFFCTGVVLTAIIKDEAAVRLFFFYCSIPFALSALSIYETATLWRHNSKVRPVQMLASAIAGLLLWIIQSSFEARCNSGFLWTKTTQYCPVLSSGWPLSSWSKGHVLAWTLPWLAIGLILLYVTYLVLAIRAFRKSGSLARKEEAPGRSYSYRGVDAVEAQTDRDVAELSLADNSPPRSYRGHSLDLPAEKEKEMV
ncbi:hypothetical protein LTR08_003370 [Meristemomyces frigidus]|nr:hypothetical protein LTR08_003370 [Meristemomyces frigidus]